MSEKDNGWIVVLSAALFSALVLASCASAPTVVLGHCEIPQRYDYVAKGPADLELKITGLEVILQDNATQRNARAALASDYNGFHDYVKDKCNGK